MVFRWTSDRNLISSWTGGGRLRQFDYCICQRQPMHNWGVKCQRGPFELLQNMICTNRNPFFYLHHSQALQPKLLILLNLRTHKWEVTPWPWRAIKARLIILKCYYCSMEFFPGITGPWSLVLNIALITIWQFCLYTSDSWEDNSNTREHSH